MAVKKGAPKIPKGYEPQHTAYKLITETYFEKPWKAPKEAKVSTRAPKEYIQKVRVVNPGALKGAGRKKGR
jgi:3-mercaptopyruvate sulfurtransferase SseA